MVKKCSKCGGEMEKGWITDDSAITKKVAKWAKTLTLFGAKNTRTLESYRCKECGYLENYAQ